MANKIWVVEPHVDDACLSMHAHMVSWIKRGINVGIFTVFSDEKRFREGLKYAKKIGARYDSLMRDDGSQGLGSSPDYSLPPLETWFDEKINNFNLVFPLGLQHPDHIEVAKHAPAVAKRYLDTPYQAKLKLGEQLQDAIQGATVESIIYPHKRKWKNVEIFKSQSKFFYYNPPESMYNIPEILVSYT